MASETAKICIAEFVGTFLLVFTVGCNVLGKTPVWAGVSIACVLMVSIYAFAGVSGANFNPAVSVALGITEAMGGPGMPWKKVGMFVGVQCVAGIVAAFCYALLFWNAFYLAPSKGFGALSAGLCEALYTFMLCFVVLNVAAAKKYSEGQGNEWYGLAIGFVIIAGAYGAGVVSGGCFNPAVALGIDLSSAGFGGQHWFFFYAFCELLGAALAALMFKLVRPQDFNAKLFADPTLASQLTCEFLGTFILVLTVGLNVLGNSPAGAFSIAASLMCMIYALGDISGANFNPAVTLAILIFSRQEMPPKKAGLYMVAQVVGGIVAAFMYSIIYNGRTFALGPQPGYKWGHVAVAEIIFTFVLCYVVLATAVSKGPTNSKSMFGLAIGSCVTVGGFAIGSISGGSLNPAVSVGIASSHMMNGGSLYNALIFSLFEFIGAGAAAAVFMTTHPKKKELPGL